VRQNLGAGVRELTALVARQEPGREQFSLKAPGLVPIATLGAVKRRIDALRLLHLEQVVLGPVRGLHEHGRVELDFDDAVLHLLYAADAEGRKHRIQAADKVAFGNGNRQGTGVRGW